MSQEILHLDGSRTLQINELDRHTVCLIRNMLWTASQDRSLTPTAQNILSCLGTAINTLTEPGQAIDDAAEALVVDVVADVKRNSSYRRGK